jgi:hypothetical protein
VITLDASEALVLLFGVAIVGTLLAVLPPWRRLMGGGRELPIHRFFAQPSIEAQVPEPKAASGTKGAPKA